MIKMLKQFVMSSIMTQLMDKLKSEKNIDEAAKTVFTQFSDKMVSNDGNSFTLTTSDNQDVRVVLQEPLNDYVAGLTEVHGQVDGQNNILCQNYIAFPKETSDAFDMKVYNEAVELMSRFPQHYIQGVQQ